MSKCLCYHAPCDISQLTWISSASCSWCRKSVESQVGSDSEHINYL